MFGGRHRSSRCSLGISTRGIEYCDQMIGRKRDGMEQISWSVEIGRGRKVDRKVGDKCAK